MATVGGYGVEYGTGWGMGRWVYRGSTTQPPRARGGSQYSEAGPGSPCRDWSGWYWEPDVPSRARASRPPLPAVGPAPLSGASPRAKPASGPITARIDLKTWKLSQNGRVSPKFTEKASHSPYIQNGLQSSPLEILRFPYLAAFSHKELMVPF